MDPGTRRWILKYARTNFWRVSVWYDYQDLVQDGFLCYAIVRAKYPSAVDPPHIHRLTQRVFTNHIHGLSKRRTDQTLEVVVDMASEMGDPRSELQRKICPDGELQRLLLEAPIRVRDCIVRLLAHPELTAIPIANYASGAHETTHDWLRRITGIEDEPDLHAAVLNYLRGL
jgi:hypothetical protein